MAQRPREPTRQPPPRIVDKLLSSGVSHLAISPDATTLAAAEGSHALRIWDLRHKLELRNLKSYSSTYAILSLAFSPNSQLLAVGSDDHMVRVWDVADGKVVHSLRGHTSPVLALTFAPSGLILASAGGRKLWPAGDNRIRLWNLDS